MKIFRFDTLYVSNSTLKLNNKRSLDLALDNVKLKNRVKN